MPRASFIRRWGLTTRGRDYQLTPAFPRLPGIIPEGPASGPPLARQPLRKPITLCADAFQRPLLPKRFVTLCRISSSS